MLLKRKALAASIDRMQQFASPEIIRNPESETQSRKLLRCQNRGTGSIGGVRAEQTVNI